SHYRLQIRSRAVRSSWCRMPTRNGAYSGRSMSAKKATRAMRIGLAGLGAGAVNALSASPGLTNHPNVELVAAADPRPEPREAFAKRNGGRTYANVEDMCKASDIDAVYILTPNALHAEHA